MALASAPTWVQHTLEVHRSDTPTAPACCVHRPHHAQYTASWFGGESPVTLKAEGQQFNPVPDHAIRSASAWVNVAWRLPWLAPTSDLPGPFVTIVCRWVSHADRTGPEVGGKC
jgi:hypothetical protein